MVLYGIVWWFECQLIIQYPEGGLLPSNLVTGQGSYHLLCGQRVFGGQALTRIVG